VLPAARRAGLEGVEKLLTANLTSTDTTERNTGHASPASRTVASLSSRQPVLDARRPGRRRRCRVKTGEASRLRPGLMAGRSLGSR
jgi:hypothetical protein